MFISTLRMKTLNNVMESILAIGRQPTNLLYPRNVIGMIQFNQFLILSLTLSILYCQNNIRSIAI